MSITVVNADYSNETHSQAIPYLLNEYAKDPMGGSEALEPHVYDSLVSELQKRSHAFSVLVFVDNEPAGLANCLEGFSTFTCKPLINIHDLCVLGKFRGLGLSQKLLQKVEDIAKERDCCKVTLEVLSNNDVAKSAYLKFGFAGYQLDPSAGHAVFWQKKIS